MYKLDDERCGWPRSPRGNSKEYVFSVCKDMRTHY